MQAERELISRTLQSRRLHQVMQAGIEPHHFYTYRPEWEWILRSWNKHGAVPSVDLFRQKFPDFKYKKIVGEDPSVTPAVEAVRNNHLENQMTSIAEEFVEQLGTDLDDPSVLLQSIQDQLQVLTGEATGEEIVDIIATIDEDVETFARIQRAEVDGHSMIQTPWLAINDRWGGLRNGELIGVIARMGEGKSWDGLNMCAVPLIDGKRAFFAALEMPRFDVAMRLHTLLSWHMAHRENPKFVKLPQVVNKARIEEMLSGRSVWRNSHLMIGSNEIDVDEYRKWTMRVQEMMPGGFVMPKFSSHSEPFTYASFERAVIKAEPDVAVLDYLTLLSDSPGRRSDWEMWRDITRRLKQLAMRLDIPIVVMAQANRNAALAKTPELQDIAFSDALGQNADRILSIKTKADRMAITCIKNRLGENRFRFWTHFLPEWGIIEQDKYAEVETNFELS